MYHHQSMIAGAATPTSSTAEEDLAHLKRGKKRGSYKCGRCGQPKKGHSCLLSPETPAGVGDSNPCQPSSFALLPPPVQASRRPYSTHLRRALSFDDVEVGDAPESEEEEEEEEQEEDLGVGGLPASCLWEVLRRLPPPALLRAAKVCKGWRETTRRLWRATEELRVQIPSGTQIGFVGSLLQKCPGLVRLSLTMRRSGSSA